MFATLALLHFDGSEQAEYSLAGHMPIVHYRHPTGDTAQLSMELPLALIPGGPDTTGRITYSAGDRFLMVTDGTTEVVNERDEEFGLIRLELVLAQHATKPLPEIWDLIMGAVRRYGGQQDDQSFLLLRVLDTE